MSDLIVLGLGSIAPMAALSVDPGMILNGKSENEQSSSFDSFLDEESELVEEVAELLPTTEAVDFRNAVPWLLCRSSLLPEFAAPAPVAIESGEVPATITKPKTEVRPRLIDRQAPPLAEPGQALEAATASPRAIAREVAVPEALTPLVGNVKAVPLAIDRDVPAGRVPLETSITPPEMTALEPRAIVREMAALPPTIKALSTALTAVVEEAPLDFSGPVAPPQTLENAAATHPFPPPTIDRDGTVPLPIKAIAFPPPKLVDATPPAIDRNAPAPQTSEKFTLTTPEIIAVAPRVIVHEATAPDASAPTREATLPTLPITIEIPSPAIGRGAPTPDAPQQTHAAATAAPTDARALPVTGTAPAPLLAERDARPANASHPTLAAVAAPPADAQAWPVTVTAPAPLFAERIASPADAPRQTLARVAITPSEIIVTAPRTVVREVVAPLPGEVSAETTPAIFTPAPPLISREASPPITAPSAFERAVLPTLEPFAPLPPKAVGTLTGQNNSPQTVEETVLAAPEISSPIQPKTTSKPAVPNAPQPIERAVIATPAPPRIGAEEPRSVERVAITTPEKNAGQKPALNAPPQPLEKAVIATPEKFAPALPRVAGETPTPNSSPLTTEEVASTPAIAQEAAARPTSPNPQPASALPPVEEEAAKSAGKNPVTMPGSALPETAAKNTASPAMPDAHSVPEPMKRGGMAVAKTPMSMKHLSPDKFAEAATSAVSTRVVQVEEGSRGENREQPATPHLAAPEREMQPGETTLLRPVFEAPAAAAHVTPRVVATELAARPAELVSVFHTVEDMVERVRGQRSGPLELDLRLSDGDRLHVRLEMRAGELQTTFEAASPELRSALQQGWSEFSQRSLERGVRLGEANFTDTPARSESSLEQDAQRQPRRESPVPHHPAPTAPRHPASRAEKATPMRGAHAGALSLWA